MLNYESCQSNSSSVESFDIITILNFCYGNLPSYECRNSKNVEPNYTKYFDELFYLINQFVEICHLTLNKASTEEYVNNKNLIFFRNYTNTIKSTHTSSINRSRYFITNHKEEIIKKVKNILN